MIGLLERGAREKARGTAGTMRFGTGVGLLTLLRVDRADSAAYGDMVNKRAVVMGGRKKRGSVSKIIVC